MLLTYACSLISESLSYPNVSLNRILACLRVSLRVRRQHRLSGIKIPLLHSSFSILPVRPHCLTVAWHLIPAGCSAFDVAQMMRYPSRDIKERPALLFFHRILDARHRLWPRATISRTRESAWVSLKGVIIQRGEICGGCVKERVIR